MKIEGIVTAMVTPLNEKGIDEIATRALVNRLIDSGVAGLFILGTNGEFYALSETEKMMLAKIVVDETNGRVPVFAGSGGISTEATIKLTNKLEKTGVTAVSVITPFLMKINDEELINHYERIVKNTNLPIILTIFQQIQKLISVKMFSRNWSKMIKLLGLKIVAAILRILRCILKTANNEKTFQF